MMERSGIARDLYRALNVWSGRVPGGLAVVTTLVGVVLAATVGVIGGDIMIARGKTSLAFAAPPLLRSGPVDEAELQRLLDLLGLRRDRVVDSNWIDNGPGWVGLLLDSMEELLAVEPATAPAGVVNVGLIAPYPPGQEFGFEVRALFTDDRGTLREDPVTGSLNAAMAQWLLGTGRARAPYVASQGARVGRAGRVDITSDASGTVWVGGATVTCVEGTLAA